MKIAILGASKFGQFHIQEFLKLDCEIVAILGSSEKTVEKTVGQIKDNFQITVRGYTDLFDLLNNETLDGVSVCTPHNLHAPFVDALLDHKIPVFCEKPFVFNNSYDDNFRLAKKLVEKAKRTNTTLHVNTQWPFILDYISLNQKPINTFTMFMEPFALSTIDCALDAMPHMNSLIISLAPFNRIENVSINLENEKTIIDFDYISTSKIKAKYIFGYKEDRPRRVWFTINGREYERVIGPNYSLSLKSGDKIIPYVDPMSLSIETFIDSIQSKKGIIKEKQILDNILIQDALMTHLIASHAAY